MKQKTFGGGRRRVAVAAAALALGLCVAPAPAYAAISHNGQEVSAGDSYTVNESGNCQGHVFSGTAEGAWYNDLWAGQHITISGGTHNITLRDLTIEDPDLGSSCINVQDGARVTITLEGTNVLEGAMNRPAIWVEEGSSLTFEGNGSLVARAGNTTTGMGAAGIGGGYDGDSFGDIIINDGNIEAYGTDGGAGIGGGYKVGSGSQSGNVTINGGFVQAFGGSNVSSSGAGIGAGENADFDGTITINGGVVRAMGGNANKSSIGGGGSVFGSTDNGTFTTGVNGHAVIAAPWGIGDTSDVANWDCILLEPTRESTSEIQFVKYTQASDGRETVTFDGGTPQVYGNVVADYDIVVNAPASLRITTDIDLDNDSSTPNNAPSTLRMKSGHTITNNNTASSQGIAGVALEPGAVLILEDGLSQCLGNGTMIATSNEGTGHAMGKVQLPISDEMVSVSPTSYVYDGKAKEPAVTVRFSKWSFQQTFKKDADYTVRYADNINKGTATATATSAQGDLLPKGGKPSTGSVSFEITAAPLQVSSVASRYVQTGEDQLLSKLPTAPSFGASMPDSVKGGTFTWYSDEKCTTELKDDAVASLAAGDTATVWWKYTQNGNNNYETEKTGSTRLTITDGEPPLVRVEGEPDDTHLTKTYGDDAVQPKIEMSLDNGQTWVEPTGDITYRVESQTPLKDGSVVSVDETGTISFLGAGEATVVATIGAYTDPDTSSSASHGPADVTITVNVKPAEAQVDAKSVAATDRAYNGTRDVAVTAALDKASTVGTDLEDGNIGVAASGLAETPAVGSNIAVEVTYELTGAKADDYVLVDGPDTTVNITKAQAGADTLQGKTGELTISNCAAATYAYDLNELVPDSKDLGNGNALYPGWIEFKNPVVKLSDGRYFDESDIRINNATHTMYLTVNDVESHVTDQLGTIEFDMVSPNYEGMKGTINVMRTDMETFNIEASAGEGGTITPAGTVEVVTEHDQTFSIAADAGYEIEDVLVDGVSQGAVSSYTFETVTADHTISATFKKVTTDPGTGENPGDNNPGDSGQNGGDGGPTTPGNQGSGNAGGQVNDGGKPGEGLAPTGDTALAAVGVVGVAAAAVLAAGAALNKKRG